MTKWIDLDLVGNDVAALLELSYIVQARIIEAVDTFDKMPAGSGAPSGKLGYWPAYFLDNPRPNNKRRQPDSHSIQRYEQVFYEWFPNYLSISSRNSLIAHAGSLVSRARFGTFKQYCEKNNINRRTAERQNNAAILELSSCVRKMHKMLLLPDFYRVSTIAPNHYSKADNMANIRSWMTEGAKPKINQELTAA